MRSLTSSALFLALTLLLGSRIRGSGGLGNGGGGLRLRGGAGESFFLGDDARWEEEREARDKARIKREKEAKRRREERVESARLAGWANPEAAADLTDTQGMSDNHVMDVFKNAWGDPEGEGRGKVPEAAEVSDREARRVARELLGNTKLKQGGDFRQKAKELFGSMSGASELVEDIFSRDVGSSQGGSTTKSSTPGREGGAPRDSLDEPGEDLRGEERAREALRGEPEAPPMRVFAPGEAVDVPGDCPAADAAVAAAVRARIYAVHVSAGTHSVFGEANELGFMRKIALQRGRKEPDVLPLGEGGFEVCGEGRDVSAVVAQWHLRKGYYGCFRDVMLSHAVEERHWGMHGGAELMVIERGAWAFQDCNLYCRRGFVLNVVLEANVSALHCNVGGLGPGDARAVSGVTVKYGSTFAAARCTLLHTGAAHGAALRALHGARVCVRGCEFEGHERALGVSPAAQVVLADSTLRPCVLATFFVSRPVRPYDEDVRQKLDRLVEWREVHEALEREEAEGFLSMSGNTLLAPLGGAPYWFADEVHHKVLTDGTDAFLGQEGEAGGSNADG